MHFALGTGRQSPVSWWTRGIAREFRIARQPFEGGGYPLVIHSRFEGKFTGLAPSRFPFVSPRVRGVPPALGYSQPPLREGGISGLVICTDWYTPLTCIAVSPQHVVSRKIFPSVASNDHETNSFCRPGSGGGATILSPVDATTLIYLQPYFPRNPKTLVSRRLFNHTRS